MGCTLVGWIWHFPDGSSSGGTSFCEQADDGRIRLITVWPGSDHFPIFIALSLEPGAEAEQEEPETDRAEEMQVSEKIEDGEEQTDE